MVKNKKGERMKKFAFLLLSFAFCVYASQSLWLHDYNKAMIKAKQVDKPILLMYSAKT